MLATVVRFLLRHLVTALMFSVGLRTSRAGLRSTTQERGLFLRELAVLELGLPLLGILVALVFPLRPQVGVIIALMAAYLLARALGLLPYQLLLRRWLRPRSTPVPREGGQGGRSPEQVRVFRSQ